MYKTNYQTKNSQDFEPDTNNIGEKENSPIEEQKTKESDTTSKEEKKISTSSDKATPHGKLNGNTFRGDSEGNSMDSTDTKKKTMPKSKAEKKQREQETVDENRKEYRKRFGIVDKYLIGLDYNPKNEDDNGYIVFIDYQNDLNYIDFRNIGDDIKEKQLQWIAKLQHAEASQCKHLPENQQLDFKRMLGAGYIHVLNENYDEIDDVIGEAKAYLKRRNREHSRYIFLTSGLPAVTIAGIVGLILYLTGVYNPWYFGIIFGIMGAFVSIWTRYGKVQFTGQARCTLHILECYSRITIGTIFAFIAMASIKCQLILPELTEPNPTDHEQLYAFILVSFIAAFSERFIPSIVERITNDTVTKDNNT